MLFLPKKREFIFQPQMDESNFLEEIKIWEHPPRYGSVQFKDKITLLSWRIRRVSSTTSRLIFGCQWSNKWFLVHETSAYRHHVEPRKSNFTRWEKNHSQFHWNTLMYPEPPTRIWMSSKSGASMIFGKSIGQEICLIFGQVSLNLLYWKRNLQTDICGPRENWQESS